MFLKKRGQVAMEFLMTYGWAILIILVAVAVLWMLGVFSPSLPTTCTIEAPFSCVDSAIGQNYMVLKIGSSNINSPKINSIEINGQTCPVIRGKLMSSQTQNIVCDGLNLEKGEKVSSKISLSYKKTVGGLKQNTEGEIAGESKENPEIFNGDFELGEFKWGKLNSGNEHVDFMSSSEITTSSYSGDYAFFKTSSASHYEAEDFIPVDTTKTYRISGFAKRTAGTGTLYLGVVPYDKDKKYISTCGSCCSYIYAAARSANPPSTWTKYEGTITGESASPSNCNVFRQGTKYVRPMFIVNYNVAGTTTYVDEIKFEEI